MASLVSSVASGVASAANYTVGAVPLILIGTAAGAVVLSIAGTLALKAVGFKAAGPAPGSVAAAWMSSTAIANGGAVAAGSLYSAVQATAMGGGLLLGSPAVRTFGAVVGAAAVVWIAWF